MITIDASVLHEFRMIEEDLILGFLEAELVIVYPTDTLYGLGVDACSQQGVAALYALKQRSSTPISVLTSDVDTLLSMTKALSARAVELIQRFLPGALTVICRTDYPFAPQLFSEKKTIGFRVPADGISTRVPALLGHPVTTTSVNPAGKPPAKSVADVVKYFDDQIPLMIDSGTLEPSRGSTIIDLTTRPFNILREGEIPRHQLEELIN